MPFPQCVASAVSDPGAPPAEATGEGLEAEIARLQRELEARLSGRDPKRAALRTPGLRVAGQPALAQTPMRTPRSHHHGPSLTRLLVATIAIVCTCALAGYAGYLFRGKVDPDSIGAFSPRRPQTPVESESAPPRESWTAELLPVLDEVLKEESQRGGDGMGRALQVLTGAHPSLPGLDLLSARQAMLSRSYADAEVRLSRVGAAPDGPQAEAQFLRARNFGARRKLVQVRSCLDAAISFDPTRAEIFYARAETDRRMGNIEEALAGYDRALHRTRAGHSPSRALMEFRRRLLLIGAGREMEIGNEVYAAEMARRPVRGEWNLTAAAILIQGGRYSDAAQWMLRARAAMPRDEYLGAIDDYFFRDHVGRAELRDCFPNNAERLEFIARASPLLVDP